MIGAYVPRMPSRSSASATCRELADEGSVVASTPTKLTPSAGRARTTRNVAEIAAIRPGPSHHPGREPTPATAGRNLLQPAWRERVDPRAEPVEEGRQGDERDEAGGQGDEDATEPHRVEELLREDEQAAHRGGDGDGAEEDGAPGAAHRAASASGPWPCTAASSRQRETMNSE